MDDRKLYLGNTEYGVIIEFLRGQRSDWDGRWLRDMRKWNYEQLEDDHHYIQWMFPLRTDSEAVFAPVLREVELENFRKDPTVQNQMIESLRQMLSFYGFVLNIKEGKIDVTPSDRHEERLLIWMTPDNHNYRRISRILGSLKLAQLDGYAESSLQALERLYQSAEGQAAIGDVAMWYWRGRASSGK